LSNNNDQGVAAKNDTSDIFIKSGAIKGFSTRPNKMVENK